MATALLTRLYDSTFSSKLMSAEHTHTHMRKHKLLLSVFLKVCLCVCTRGDLAELLLQSGGSVVSSEHLGRQAGHGLVQVLVQIPRLNNTEEKSSNSQ